MRDFRDVKDIYNTIRVPNNLDDIIIRNFKETVGSAKDILLLKKIRGILIDSFISIIIMFVALLNTNALLVKYVSDIPIIGPISEFLTFRDYADFYEELIEFRENNNVVNSININY